MHTSSSDPLDEKRILQAFSKLSDRLAAEGVRGEVCVVGGACVGGACMVLAFKARPTTKDVDAITFSPDRMLRLAFSVGQELNLPLDWFNAAAKQFISRKKHETREFNVQFPNLQVLIPTPEYMLAMKCLASRVSTIAGAADDKADIKFLLQHLNLKTPEEALSIVGQYYPLEKLPPRASALLESTFNELAEEKQQNQR